MLSDTQLANSDRFVLPSTTAPAVVDVKRWPSAAASLSCSSVGVPFLVSTRIAASSRSPSAR